MQARAPRFRPRPASLAGAPFALRTHRRFCARAFSTPATTPEFFRDIPKADLHVHLDGSLRMDTIIELAKAAPGSVPRIDALPELHPDHWTVDLLGEHVFKAAYTGLPDYLQGFALTTSVMRTPAGLTRVAYELAKDCQADRVLYVEPRFAPQLLASDHMGPREVLRCVHEGFEMAKKEYNANNPAMPFDYGIIVCGMRHFNEHFSPYYQRLCALFPSLPPKQLAGIASYSLVQEAVAARDEDGVPVVALDIAGAEAGYPCDDHIKAFRLAHQSFLHSTVHAGEAYGPESIAAAITDLYATRLGHGYHLYHPDSILDAGIQDKALYTRRLVDFIHASDRTIEVCLTSNLQTLPALQAEGLQSHSLGSMLRDGLSVAICTDNTLVSNTSMSNELHLAAQHFEAMRDPSTMESVVLNGFRRAFHPGSAAGHQAMLRQATAAYRQAAAKHGVDRVLQGC